MMMSTGSPASKLGALLVASTLLVALVNSMECAPDTKAVSEREAEEAVIGRLQEAHAAQGEVQQDESYQRVYEAFTKLVQNVSNNSLGNARRLVSRLNQLVGGTEPAVDGAKPVAPVVEQVKRQQPQPQQQSSEEQRTEQILQRLDQVNKQTDQNTLRQLQDDVNRLVGTLSESYLRNVRRVIERVNRTIGSSSQQLKPPASNSEPVLHQSGDRFEQGNPDGVRQPGFPGWDELIVAVDRMQKSLANFVRSSTKLITAGRR